MPIYPGIRHDFHKLQSVASTLSWFPVVILRDVEPNIAKLFLDEDPSESYIVHFFILSDLTMVFGATFD